MYFLSVFILTDLLGHNQKLTLHTTNYAALVPTQIRIHEDGIYISNDCVFPVGWTAETLMERYRSQPYNPNIANGFFRAEYVETWGVG